MTFPSLKSLLLGKKYIGVEHFSLDNEDKMAFLLIEKKKGELIIAQKTVKPYLEIIPDRFNKKLPFYLIINTNQVIQKEIAEIDPSNEKLLHKAFPNLVWNDFYYEILRLKTKSIIAISRKSYVDELVFQYQKQGISIVGISLGICSVAEIINYSSTSNLTTNHQSISLELEDQMVTNKTATINATYDINGLQIQGSHLLAFSGILRLLMGTSLTTGNIIDNNYNLYDNYNQQNFFSKGIQVMVGALITILLINFFVFNNYYKKTQEISEKLSLNNFSQEEVIKTKKRIAAKEHKLLSVLGTFSQQCSSNINEITKQIPSSILLSELVYNPLDKKIKTDENIIVQTNTIIISGATINNNAFTKWLETVRKLKFVKEVVIINFGKNETNETLFSIKLILNETK